MEADAKKTFPMIPSRMWWDLRRQFKSSWPRGTVDAGYVASVLKVDDRTAKNVLPNLRRLGLVDDNGRATDLAQAWREDERYREATQQMLEAAYPQGLLDVAPPPDPDLDVVQRWLAREARAGDAYAKQLGRFYVLLAKGDPKGAEDAQAPRGIKAERVAPNPPRNLQVARPQSAAPSAKQVEAANPTPESGPAGPSVHIDIQVHIDPAATAEQIDQIFGSMARHLYGRK